MEILALIILALTLIQLLVALANFLFSERMKISIGNQEALVSILVPARNESGNIATLIRSVRLQEYQNFELIVCDDQSDDDTAEIVKELVQLDQRVRLIQTSSLPHGWLGKNHACFTLSQHARGKYLLFLDADVVIEGSLIGRLIRHMQHFRLSLISIFPKQMMQSSGEYKTVPVMNYILLTLLPLMLVRISHFSSLSAANGQCMFFNAETYQKIQPHALLRNNKVEDIAIARMLKKEKLLISCQASEKQISCRMYQNYSEAIQGFSRNISAYFGQSNILAALFWLLTTLGIIPILLTGNWYFMLAYLFASIIIHILVIITSNQPLGSTLKFLPHQQLAMGQFIFQSILHQYNRKENWKGRNISL